MNKHKTVKRTILATLMAAPLLFTTGCLTAGPDGEYDIIGFLVQPIVAIPVLLVIGFFWLKGRKK